MTQSSIQRVIPTLRITGEARSRDGMTFYLSQHVMDCAVGGLIHLFVDRVDDWHAELGRKGVAVDPDGNRLRICTRLPSRVRERSAGHP